MDQPEHLNQDLLNHQNIVSTLLLLIPNERNEEQPLHQSHLKTDGEYFDHCLYNKYEINSHAFNLIRPLLDKLNVKAIIQARLNLLIAKETPQFSEFHVDYTHGNKTAILYLNTCNGYTEFFDEKKTKVYSQENKIVIFDGQIQHRAVSQTDNKRRIVLNLNYY